MKALESEHIIFFKNEEALWRLKSRVTWLEEGDKNSKFFHKVALGRRLENSIWHIEHGGNSLNRLEDIKEATVDFFGSLFKKKEEPISE